MIAYNNEWLKNLSIRNDVDNAFDENCISKEEQENIYKKYPVEFYTPNIFTRIGLFILTCIILSFSYGLLALIFISNIERMLDSLAIFFSILMYVALEYMIKQKKHYRSGVDDALLWGFACTLFFAISLPHDFGGLTNCMIIFIISCYCSIRFANGLMAVVAYLSMLGILFYACLEFGAVAKTIAPFVIMAASLAIYFISRKIKLQQDAILYLNCINMILIASLISFYVAGNYYIVRELSNAMFDLNLKPADGIPMGWLFWIFTSSIPLIYILRGIQKKDAILLRVGLLLVAAIVFTIRYYHTIMPVEILMTISGILLLAVGYALMKYLHEPKYGFTYKEISAKNAMDKLNIEALVISQSFVPGTTDAGTEFGGGSFGGGGSSSNY